MKWLSCLAIVTMFVGTTPNVFAQGDKKPIADELFSRLDKNGDGFVTKDEAPGEEGQRTFDRVLKAGDKNGDGKLTKEELAAGLAGAKRTEEGGDVEKRPAFDPESFFNRLDKNGDGKISKDEIPERGAEFVQRLDANKDGEITKEEFKAGAAKARPTGDAPRPAAGGDGLLFRALDSDGDGKISTEEMSRAGEALKKLDRNGDGFVSREELGGAAPSAGGAPKSGGVLERIKQADKNGDGKLSKEEAPERLKENFDRIDANEDGFLDQDEMRKWFGAQKEKAKQAKQD